MREISIYGVKYEFFPPVQQNIDLAPILSVPMIITQLLT